MLQNISKKRFFTNFKSTRDDAISFGKSVKKSWRHFFWRAFLIYLFYLINSKIMMRSIFKLTLKAIVALNNILETGILIIFSSIFRDIHKLQSVYN